MAYLIWLVPAAVVVLLVLVGRSVDRQAREQRRHDAWVDWQRRRR
ncbi:MAG: hypothetical protein ACRDLV_08225 [Solirubrobacteraceae bacterium]